MRRLQKKLELQKELEDYFISLYNELKENTKLLELNQYCQHGNTSCLRHSIAVAYYSCCLAELFSINVDKRSLIRGALLHDYFLYDWHVKDKSHSMHGFRHPGTSLRNAIRDTSVNAIERDMIKHHMFPLTPMPPKCREAIILCMVDKVCSIYELRKRQRYERICRLVMV